MTSPTDPKVCTTTGRVLTEWFEYPEYTDEQIEEMACAAYGVDPADRPKLSPTDPKASPELLDLQRRINAFKAKFKGRRWKNGMTQQEVQVRMNEATKMIDPTNYKFLPEDVRERTGLEINPLWMIECLVRSGVLPAKEQVAALKELAQYSHSKAPNISHNTTTHMKPEDWLLELAKEEYQEIEIKQPMTPIERTAGPLYEKRLEKKIRETSAVISYGASELSELEAQVDAEWEEVDDN